MKQAKLVRYMRFGPEWASFQSSNPKKTFQSYVRLLKLGQHPNKQLQELYNRYGTPEYSKTQP